MKTKLKLIHTVGSSDFGIGAVAYGYLLQAQIHGTEVTVDDLEVDQGDPNYNYYNVTLANGTKIPALSGIHLVDIENFGKRKGAVLSLQYAVELFVEDATPETGIDARLLETQISLALERMLAGCGFIGFTTKVGSVQFETSFTVPSTETQ